MGQHHALHEINMISHTSVETEYDSQYMKMWFDCEEEDLKKHVHLTRSVFLFFSYPHIPFRIRCGVYCILPRKLHKTIWSWPTLIAPALLPCPTCPTCPPPPVSLSYWVSCVCLFFFFFFFFCASWICMAFSGSQWFSYSIFRYLFCKQMSCSFQHPGQQGCLLV